MAAKDDIVELMQRRPSVTLPVTLDAPTQLALAQLMVALSVRDGDYQAAVREAIMISADRMKNAGTDEQHGDEVFEQGSLVAFRQ